MGYFFTPFCISAVCTALAGVVLFALSPYLPAPFPSSVTRLVGFTVLLTTILPLWVATGSWAVTASVDGAGVAAMIVVHVLQTRTTKDTKDTKIE